MLKASNMCSSHDLSGAEFSEIVPIASNDIRFVSMKIAHNTMQNRRVNDILYY